MSDRPIIFGAPMVRALLDGRKTQTRRVLKPQPSMPFDAIDRHGHEWCTADAYTGASIEALHVRYVVGDRLWVRETWGINHSHYMGRIPKARPAELEDDYLVYFATESDPDILHEMPARPSIHMPRWASRITLTVTEVRVQRLQEISEADAEAEGGLQLRSGRWVTAQGEQYAGKARHSARGWFSQLWDQLHGPGAWDANPWVVALTFAVAQQNIDAESRNV